MAQHYSTPRRESDPYALPDGETFEVEEGTSLRVDPDDGCMHEETTPGQSAHDCQRDGCLPAAPGWYWWACFPGCLPDGVPMGPFATERDAIADAREGFDDFAEEEGN